MTKDAVQNNPDLKSTLASIGTDSDHLFQVMINPSALKNVASEHASRGGD